MTKQEIDYNAGYRQAVEDVKELLLQSHDYRKAIDANEWHDIIANYSSEFRDGYHDALQKLYNMFTCLGT